MARKRPNKRAIVNHPGRFQKGNQVAKGNPGPWGGRVVTQVIISKLNEVDKTTSKEYVYLLVDELFEQALPTYELRGKKKVRVPGDLGAIKEIIDRADGRAVQAQVVSAPEGIHIYISPDDEKV